MQISATKSWKAVVKEYIDSLPDNVTSGYSKTEPHTKLVDAGEGSLATTVGEWVTIKLYISHESN